MATSDELYVFRSIRKLMIGEDAGTQQLCPSGPWMLLPISGLGVARIEHPRQLYMLTVQGAALSWEGGERLSLQLDPGSAGWSLYYLEFERLRIVEDGRGIVVSGPEQGRTASVSVPVVVERGWSAELGERAERLHYAAHMLEDSRARALRVQLELQELLLWWIAGERQPAVQRTTEQAVREVQQEMELRYAEEWRRSEQAARVGIAEGYYSALFKKLSGVQPSVYLDRLRVHRAAELLLQARDRKGDLEEIARQVGFRDAWYLSKRFRALMGTGPAEYRKRHVPQRVASLQYPYTHHLLALGIEPAMARFGSYPEMETVTAPDGCVRLPALATMETQRQMLLERQLDLILTYEQEEMQARWRQAAPVAYVPWLGMDWREHLRTIAGLFGRERAAEACIRSIDAQAAELRQMLHGRCEGRTVSIIKLANQRCYLYGVRDVGCVFYELLGCEPPALIRARIAQESNLHSIEIAMSQLADCLAELHVVIVAPDQDESLQSMRWSEHWRAFEAAAAGRILYLDPRQWLHYDPIHLQLQLRSLQEMAASDSWPI